MDDDSVVAIRCPNALNRNLCIICQSNRKKNDQLSSIKTSGKETLLLRAEERKALYDCQYSIAISRILNTIKPDDEDCDFVYHRTCYSLFTSKEKIERMKTKVADAKKKTTDEKSKAPPVTRSKT
ncbi:hypothetical protein RI129_000856 [Pyrocoelia pectoralis]|uniref:Uncharacterized protein n=1 Tax=Pyrocoelia pectoralis TaxID=417401 RepID=A0AAN7VJR0_9COLE